MNDGLTESAYPKRSRTPATGAPAPPAAAFQVARLEQITLRLPAAGAILVPRAPGYAPRPAGAEHVELLTALRAEHPLSELFLEDEGGIYADFLARVEQRHSGMRRHFLAPGTIVWAFNGTAMLPHVVEGLQLTISGELRYSVALASGGKARPLAVKSLHEGVAEAAGGGGGGGYQTGPARRLQMDDELPIRAITPQEFRDFVDGDSDGDG